jgi:V/A-type H+-transporting ATPase subunit E
VLNPALPEKRPYGLKAQSYKRRDRQYSFPAGANEMDQKIAELTDKLFKEGVEKGESEAHRMIDGAQVRAKEILEEARAKADQILADAQTASEDLKKKTASEIKLSGTQAVNAIKQQIVDALLAKQIDAPVTSALSDPAVVSNLLSIIITNWKTSSAEPLEALLPESKRTELEKSLTASLSAQIKQGLTITFSKSVKGGFSIGPKDGGFKISLTDEDFINFFRDFLRPRARTFLFGE